MIKVIFIGSGAVAAEVSSYIEDLNKVNNQQIIIAGFLDDSFDNYKKYASNYMFSSEYLGRITDWDFSDKYHYILGFANINARANLINKLDLLSINWLNIIHPTVQISNSAIIEKGTIIYPNCVIGPNVKIGRFNLITSFSFVSHDCILGENNFLSTSGLSGNVTIGNNNFLKYLGNYWGYKQLGGVVFTEPKIDEQINFDKGKITKLTINLKEEEFLSFI